MKKHVDWQFIQQEYDSGKSLRDITKIHGICQATLNKASKDGRLKVLSRQEANARRIKLKPSRKLTNEEKKAISIRMIELFRRRPELHPNRKVANNRSVMSYPERLAYDWLVANKIDFIHNARIGQYYVDFLLGSIAIEIDGERWHDKISDEKRDTIIRSLGINIVRIPAYAITLDSTIIRQAITGDFKPELLANYRAAEKVKHYCECGRPKFRTAKTCRACRPGKSNAQWPSNLLELVYQSSMRQVGLQLGVSQRSVARHICKNFGYQPSGTDSDSFKSWYESRQKVIQ